VYVSTVRPFMKRVGGKTKLLPELKARLPKTYKRYFEPFVGGGALFFDLAPADAVLGDASVELVDTYRGLKYAVEDVIAKLAVHATLHAGDTYYYTVRTAWNQGQWRNDLAGHAAAFLYLNKTCFNGLWRVNKAGAFNVPKGAYANPTICNANALRQAADVLASATLSSDEYYQTASFAERGDFVYFDPPYDPVSKTSNFTAYTKDVFGYAEQEVLADHARTLALRGVSVMLSNNDTPFIRSLYQDFCIDTVPCARSINSKGSKRGPVSEVIITNYGATS
jgi:DNA adenine methylase